MNKMDYHVKYLVGDLGHTVRLGKRWPQADTTSIPYSGRLGTFHTLST